MARRDQILRIAADLFASRGFHGVSVGDIGVACGISGPALYKHFGSKEALLAELLVGISEELLAGGQERAPGAHGPARAVCDLVDFHVDFAVGRRALIVVQDRDWESLPADAREQVRGLQRSYVDLWARELRALHDGLPLDRARTMAHVGFGLINSTPHSALLPDDAMRELLREMALRALDHPLASGSARPAQQRVSTR